MRTHQMGSIKKATELDNPGHATSCVTDLPPLVQQKKNEKKIFTEDLEGDKCVHARNVTHEDGTIVEDNLLGDLGGKMCSKW